MVVVEGSYAWPASHEEQRRVGEMGCTRAVSLERRKLLTGPPVWVSARAQFGGKNEPRVGHLQLFPSLSTTRANLCYSGYCFSASQIILIYF